MINQLKRLCISQISFELFRFFAIMANIVRSPKDTPLY